MNNPTQPSSEKVLIISDTLSNTEIQEALHYINIETEVISSNEKVRSSLDPTIIAASLIAFQKGMDITKKCIIPIIKELKNRYGNKKPGRIVQAETSNIEVAMDSVDIDLDLNDKDFENKLKQLYNLPGKPNIFITIKRND